MATGEVTVAAAPFRHRPSKQAINLLMAGEGGRNGRRSKTPVDASLLTAATEALKSNEPAKASSFQSEIDIEKIYFSGPA